MAKYSANLSCLAYTNISSADLADLELDEFVGEFSEFVPEGSIPEEEGSAVSLHLVPMAALGLFLTLLFIASVFRAIRARRVSEKFYALLVNRAIGDVMYMALYIVDHLFEVAGFSADLTGPLNTVISGVFWAAMVSYVTLSLMKLFAIAQPLQYRKWATMTRVLELIVISWVGFIVFVSVRIYVRETCLGEHCLMQVHRVIGAMHVGCYLLTVLCFVFTVLFVWRATKVMNNNGAESRKSVSKKAAKQRFQIPLVKLSLNVSTLAILHFPLTMVGVLLTFGSERFWHEVFPCFVIANISTVRLTAALIQFVFMLRIILDPLICFAIDREVRRCLFSMFGVGPKIETRQQSSQSSTTARTTV